MSNESQLHSVILGWATRLLRWATLLVIPLGLGFDSCVAQRIVQGGEATPEMTQRMRRAGGHGPRPAVRVAQNKPPENNKGDQKDEAKKEEKKEEKAEEVVERPESPDTVPDPRDLQVQLDEDDMVPPFTFVGQGWPDVMQWLASITDHSLDWQQLPKGFLNLTTQRRLTPPQTRDLINRHLHARGFTILAKDNVLSVFKLDELDPSLIPQVTEEVLYERQPHDIVKTVFQLPEGADINKLVEELPKILSPQAKVLPLVSTERLLVIDVVANIRHISEILNQERTDTLKVENLREFKLRYARAEKVIDILYVMLSLDPASQPTQMELQIRQQEMQLLQQMQQAGKDVSRMLNKEGPPVYLVFNRRRNSIIANAPPTEMRMIEKAVEWLDVPSSDIQVGSRSDDQAEASQSAWDSTSRELKKYKLVSMDPGVLQLTLEEIGNLHPLTELRADNGAKMLFARANERDHQTIQSMIDELDGTGRHFEIIRLRYKPAEMVAAGIYNLMVGEEEEEEDNSRSWYSWYRSSDNDSNNKPNKGFRVYADVESNSLWLWANDAELKAVKNFLSKLGEIPGEHSPPRMVREFNSFDPESVNELLQQIREGWPVENQLDIVPAPAKDPEEETDEKSTEADEEDRRASAEDATQSTYAVRATGHSSTVLVNNDDATTDAAEEDAATPVATGSAPIKISVTEDGRLLVTSADTEALRLVEEYIQRLIPSGERFKRFPLQHIRAMEMMFILEDLFAEEMKDDDQEQMLDWWGRVRDVGKEPEKTFSVTRRATLDFDYEDRSNALLVANATPRQLREIERLIEIYDRPISEDLVVRRQTEAIKIRYSRATIIANALKDTYRDLLSQRDRAFDTGNDEDSSRVSTAKQYWSVIRYGGPGDGTPGQQKTEQVPARFDGALAIGVDEVANMIIVSASVEIFDSVVNLIHQLDEEARPRTTVAVHRVDGSMHPEHLRGALAEALGQPWLGGRPYEAQQQAQQQQQEQQQEQREPRRESRRGRGNGGGESRD